MIVVDLPENWDELAAKYAAQSVALEAARKVADAAVAYMELNDGSDELDAEAWCCLDDAVREYRKLQSSLSPAKQAVVDRALERVGEMEDASTA